jgi:hypothetical protein
MKPMKLVVVTPAAETTVGFQAPMISVPDGLVHSTECVLHHVLGGIGVTEHEQRQPGQAQRMGLVERGNVPFRRGLRRLRSPGVRLVQVVKTAPGRKGCPPHPAEARMPRAVLAATGGTQEAVTSCFPRRAPSGSNGQR